MSSKIKLPLDVRLVKAFNNRGEDQTLNHISQNEREETLRDFIKMFQKMKEFRELSEMSIKQIYLKSQLVQLGMNEIYRIENEHKLDFFLLIKGECRLEFEVNRSYDPNASNQVFKEMSAEELAS